MGIQRRNTRQRALVLQAVRGRNDHPTADDIFLDVRRHDERISRGTVYRNLNLLTDTGEILMVDAPGCSRFDWRVDGHSHIVCTSCGCVQDAIFGYDRELDRSVATASGFSDVHHSTLFRGTCAACRRAADAARDGGESL